MIPRQLRIIAMILIVGGCLNFIWFIRALAADGLTGAAISRAIPIIQVAIGVGLLRRMPAARIAGLVWFAIMILYGVTILLTLGRERSALEPKPGILVFRALIALAVAIYGYRVLTRPTVSAAFAPLD